MSAAPKLLPDPLPLHVEGGSRFIPQPTLRDFPYEYRAVVREVWDVLIERDLENVTILPPNLTDLVLSQLTGRSGRSIQEGLYFLELGPAACHVLAGIERRLRDATRAGDADGAARLRAELVEFRAARQDLKDRFKAAAGRMAAISSKGELTDADRARLAELAAERAAVRAELVAPDALILRHSGPGFGGDRFIEIIRRLAGGKSKGARKPRPQGGEKPGKGSPMPNVVYRESTPEHIAAAAAANAAAVAGENLPEPDAEGQAALDRYQEERRRRAATAERKRPRPAIELGPQPRDPSAPGMSAQALLEARRKEAAERAATPPAGSIQAMLEAKGKELGFRAVPEPDDTS